MTSCPICKDTGAVTKNKYGWIIPGIDLRYGNRKKQKVGRPDIPSIDACPHCAQLAENEYRQMKGLS